MKRFILPVLFATTLLGSALNAWQIPPIEVLEKLWTEASSEWEKMSTGTLSGQEMRFCVVSNQILAFQSIITCFNENPRGFGFKGQDIQQLKDAVDVFVAKNDVMRCAVYSPDALNKQWNQLCDEWRMDNAPFRARKIIEFKAAIGALADALTDSQSHYSSETRWMRRFQDKIGEFIVSENIAQWA